MDDVEQSHDLADPATDDGPRGTHGAGRASALELEKGERDGHRHSSVVVHLQCFMSFIGKTGSLIGLNALRDLVSDSMAIDMGSANTIIAVRGRGIVIDEPSVVAVDKITGDAIAFGSEAHKMQGREARDVMVISPLVDGVVHNRIVVPDDQKYWTKVALDRMLSIR